MNERKKRRSSIKLPGRSNENWDSNDNDDTRAKPKKRVSFAASLDVKHFDNDWNTKSSENSNDTDATKTSVTSELSNFDLLLKGNVLPEASLLTCSGGLYTERVDASCGLNTENDINSTKSLVSEVCTGNQINQPSEPVQQNIDSSREESFMTKKTTQSKRQLNFLDRMLSYDPPSVGLNVSNMNAEPMDISMDVRSSILEQSNMLVDMEKKLSSCSSTVNSVLREKVENIVSCDTAGMTQVRKPTISDPFVLEVSNKENSQLLKHKDGSFSKIPIYSPRVSRSSMSSSDQSKNDTSSKSVTLVKKLDALLPNSLTGCDEAATLNDLTDLSVVNMDISEMSTLVAPAQYTAMYCNPNGTSTSSRISEEMRRSISTPINESIEQQCSQTYVNNEEGGANDRDANTSKMNLDSSLSSSLTFQGSKSLLSSTRVTAVIPHCPSVKTLNEDEGDSSFQAKRKCPRYLNNEGSQDQNKIGNSSMSIINLECDRSETVVYESPDKASQAFESTLSASQCESLQTSLARLNSCRKAQSLHNSLLQCSMNMSLQDTLDKPKSAADILYTLRHLLSEIQRIKSVAKSEWNRLDSLLAEKFSQRDKELELKQSQYASKLLFISEEIKTLLSAKESTESALSVEYAVRDQLEKTLIGITEKIVDMNYKNSFSKNISCFVDYLHSWISGWKLFHHYDQSYSYVYLKSLVNLKFTIRKAESIYLCPQTLFFGYTDPDCDKKYFAAYSSDLQFTVNVLRNSRRLLERYYLIRTFPELNEYMQDLSDSTYRFDQLLRQLHEYSSSVGGLSIDHDTRTISFLFITSQSSVAVHVNFEISADGHPICESYQIEPTCEPISLDHLESIKNKLHPVLTAGASQPPPFTMKNFINALISC